MKSCHILHENLFAYTEGHLSPSTAEMLDKHIAGCSECALVLTEFKSAMNVIEQEKNIDVRLFAETRILQGIESKLENRRPQYNTSLKRLLQSAIISFGFVTAITIGLFIGYEGVNTRQELNRQNTESVRTDLNIPDMIYEESFTFTE